VTTTPPRSVSYPATLAQTAVVVLSNSPNSMGPTPDGSGWKVIDGLTAKKSHVRITLTLPSTWLRRR
jgi:hypothetical protein